MYCTSIKHGSYEEWNFASLQYDKENDANSKRELNYGMSCTRDHWVQIKYLNNQLDQNKTRSQDSLNGLRFSAINPYASDITWSFIKSNWDTLLTRFGGSMSFGTLISLISKNFNTLGQYNEVII